MSETIAALATPPGVGGVCIIRMSGKEAISIACRIAGRDSATPRLAHYAVFRDRKGELIDRGLLLTFPAPHSYTGEDVAELQGHGGIAVAEGLLAAALDYGARAAEPGEFTRRAFLNDKMDLSRAEAVADLIAARSQAALRAANRSLQGEFSRRVEVLAQEITAIRLYVEAALDFPEEEIDFLSEGGIANRLQQWGAQLAETLAQARQGQLLNDGIDLVLAGKPNAGKSSLLNALSGEDRAIVTELPGTTRDIVRESLVIEGIPVNLLDTAGLRDSDDPIEREGIRRSCEAIGKAQLIALLVAGDRLQEDDGQDLLHELRALAPQTPLLLLYNKADITPVSLQKRHADGIWLSAKTGEGLAAVRHAVAQTVGKTEGEAPFVARERHIRALLAAQTHFQRAVEALFRHHAGELLAEDLRAAHDALGEITGKIRADDLLGEIFAGFCIGK